MNPSKNIVFTLILMSFSIISNAQSENYLKVKVFLNEKNTATQLAKLGVEADHGQRGADFLINDFSQSEYENIKAAGFKTDVIVDNVVQYYANQNNDVVAARGTIGCQAAPKYKQPKRFRLGKMGGYYKYADLLAILDSMRVAYPKLISARAEIGTTKTHEGRPVYWFRISDNPDTEDKTEPQILYTALHHAREPSSVSQMIYYMWYLLENYNSNPEVKYLVNNTEMYFVPCVNPDGYIYNEVTMPNGGGLWRKNRRKNADGSFGVDLNRNYGFYWGKDDIGSSPTPKSETYRGPSAFSEPETQIVKEFCEAHKFVAADNYHTYGNLLIYPWSYSDQVATPDYREYAKLLTCESGFQEGTVTETVGYNVNGDSDDWMWGEAKTKNQIITFTPELADNSFWPPAYSIANDCMRCLRSNLDLAWLPLNLVRFTDYNPTYMTSKQGDFSLSLKRYGITTSPASVQIKALSNNIMINNSVKIFNLKQFENQQVTYNYTLDSNIKSLDEIKFLVSINNGDFTKYDTLRKYYLNTNPIWANNGNSFTNWFNNGINSKWNLTLQSFKSAPSSITDSPSVNYANSSTTMMQLKDPIDLKNTKKAIFQYYAKWAIEAGNDFAQVMVSTNNITYTPLCGNYTKPGGPNQDIDQPCYDGVQKDWVLEQVDLSAYLGQKIWLGFKLQSNAQINDDGFYVDDLSVVTNNFITAIDDTQIADIQVFPNPTSDFLFIKNDKNTQNELYLFDASGKLLRRVQLESSTQKIDLSDLANGLYFYQIRVENQVVKTEKIVVAH